MWPHIYFVKTYKQFISSNRNTTESSIKIRTKLIYLKQNIEKKTYFAPNINFGSTPLVYVLHQHQAQLECAERHGNEKENKLQCSNLALR